MGDCKNNLIDEVKEGDEVRGSFKDEATGKTYTTTGKIINNPKTKQSFVEDERGGITPIEDFFFLRNIKNENNYYPGISYQRLFNQINESGLNPTISQMTDIIHVVKTDFFDDKKEAGKMYSGKEVADMMKGSCKAGLKESTISDNSYKELLKDRALVSQHNVDLIKDLKAQREQLARKDNKIRLLRKALTRMVAEFDTTTPVIPNQKEAVRYANNLLQSNAE
jgi:hypothetical protein